MDPITCVPITWRGQPATLVACATHEAVITGFGAHLAALRLRGDPVNPLWEPPWQPADPTALGAAQAADLGGPGDGPLLATIAGSNLCCDRFGPPWPGERKPPHGEVAIVRFAVTGEAERAVFRARLPEAALEIERTVAFDRGELVLTVTVRHAGAAPRPVEWCEHTTLGGDFLEGLACEADIDAAYNNCGQAEPGSRFASAAPCAVLPVAAVLRVPQDADPPCGDVLTSRVRTGAVATWRAVNRRLGRRLSASFSPDEFPWMAVWTQHRSRTGAPWLGRTRSRGLEITTKPFPESKPPAERATAWQGRPTECLVPAGPAGLSKTLRLRWERC
jgi:hypothetical protein